MEVQKFFKRAALLAAMVAVCIYAYRLHLESFIPKGTHSLEDFPKSQRELNILRRNSVSNDLINVDIDKEMDSKKATLTLHSYLDNQDTICRRKIIMGNLADGGWEICDDKEVRPVPPCIIYSFGIGGDWTFDEDSSRFYGCHVFSFDPTIGQKKQNRTSLIHFYPWGIGGVTEVRGNGWQFFTLRDIKKKLGHKNKKIDIIKMDIEYSEWAVLPQVLSSHELDGTRQMYLEFHLTEKSTTCLKTIQAIERDGWRKFYVAKNPACPRKILGFPAKRTICYEVMYMRY